tara:strand:- start:257 stop:856 length:600 start_codon:yes stop_codon:yes gene_type:complete
MNDSQFVGFLGPCQFCQAPFTDRAKARVLIVDGARYAFNTDCCGDDEFIDIANSQEGGRVWISLNSAYEDKTAHNAECDARQVKESKKRSDNFMIVHLRYTGPKNVPDFPNYDRQGAWFTEIVGSYLPLNQNAALVLSSIGESFQLENRRSWVIRAFDPYLFKQIHPVPFELDVLPQVTYSRAFISPSELFPLSRGASS